MSISRRDFLRAAAGAPAVLSLGSPAPAFLERAAAADAQPDAERVLVVVQLSGGNDGLNTVVPYEDDHYGRSRRTLRMTKHDVLPIGSDLGLHRALEALKRLLDQGHLGIVQGVGYPNPHGGHNESLRIWQTSRLDAAVCQTGWLGRAVDALQGATGVAGAYVGAPPRPLVLNASRTIVPTVRSIEDWTWRGRVALADDAQDASPLLGQVARRMRSAQAQAAAVEQVSRSSSRRQYPDTPLAANLRIIAQLIEARVGLRIFHTDAGGGGDIGAYDNHAGQKDNHAALLRQLGEAVAAFADDLQRRAQLERVLLVTCSEFGRTIQENGRRGTDHGSAAPLFVVGSRVRAGLIGTHPRLSETENGGLRHHTDFRRVYAALLEHWLGIDSQLVLGERFEPLELLA